MEEYRGVYKNWMKTKDISEIMRINTIAPDKINGIRLEWALRPGLLIILCGVSLSDYIILEPIKVL